MFSYIPLFLPPFFPLHRDTNRRGPGAEEVSISSALSGGVAKLVLGGRECGVGGGGDVRGEEDRARRTERLCTQSKAIRSKVERGPIRQEWRVLFVSLMPDFTCAAARR